MDAKVEYANRDGAVGTEKVLNLLQIFQLQLLKLAALFP